MRPVTFVTIETVALRRALLVSCLGFALLACASGQDQLRSDAQQALSVVNESLLLAREGQSGRLSASFQAAQADELADEAEQAASTLDGDGGHDDARKRLANDARQAASMLRSLEEKPPDVAAFEHLAADARDAAGELGAS